jgi:hypothetical protein
MWTGLSNGTGEFHPDEHACDLDHARRDFEAEPPRRCSCRSQTPRLIALSNIFRKPSGAEVDVI